MPVTPRTPQGVMELLPRQQLAFQHMMDTIRRGYERFGFLPVETPVFETVETLLTKSGGETEKQVYFVQSTGARQQGKDPELALRFDLTVPLARYVAEHERDLAFPFRRYQMQRVYRGERAQKGRYREFYQSDIDVIGKDVLPLLYDAEMPAVIYHIFTELQVGRFVININNRKLLRGLLTGLGVPDGVVQALVLRELDKLDKVGAEQVQQSLCQGECALSPETAASLLGLLGTEGGNAELLARLRALPLEEPLFHQGVAELAAVLEGMAAFGVPESHVRVNLAIARGLDYYTGTVYETFLSDMPGLGSVCSGGRYDDLASHYTRSRLPGVGISIGVTRLFSRLLEAGWSAGAPAATSQVLVTQMDAAYATDCLGLAATLRAGGINTEVQVDPGKIGKQIKYADRVGIPVVLLLGEEEKRRGVVTLRHLGSGRQDEVPAGDVVAGVRRMLNPAES